MLKATFYQFAKRDNSTVRPADDAGLSFNIALKAPTDLNNPQFIMYLGNGLLPVWNYVYVPELRRYYFINGWSYIDQKNWMCDCTCDVLATYKYDIGSQTQYVVRSASRTDGNIPDLLYPATNDVITQTRQFESPWMHNPDINMDDGIFVLGCESRNGNVGSLCYYVVDSEALQRICKYLTSDFVSEDNHFKITDASIALQNSLINPLQYIRTCMWYPLTKQDIATLTRPNQNIMIYDQYIVWEDESSINHYVQGDLLYDTAVLNMQSIVLGKLSHPQTQSHGRYVNCAPFTEVSLKLPPFGVIQLDATVINAADNLTLDMYVDMITGKLIAEIKSGVSTLNRISTQLGVPIQLSQVTRNYLGAVTSAVGAVTSALSLDFLGAANGIGNAIQQAAPRVNSIGSNGGFADLYGDLELMYTFYMQTEVNNVNHGRPLMRYVQLGTLSGYMEVETADIVIECSAEERQRIINYLQNGFYYE